MNNLSHLKQNSRIQSHIHNEKGIEGNKGLNLETIFKMYNFFVPHLPCQGGVGGRGRHL